jgi:type II secretory pathway predicted ATPase ExeA
MTPGYQLAWQSMIAGIEERQGMVVVYGESGLGKTTLARAYMESVPPQTVKIVYLADAALSFAELLQRIAQALGHDMRADFASDMLSELHTILLEEYRQNRTIALIIDHAHHLSPVTFANLGLLAGWEHDGMRLMQIVLLGQPALAEALRQQTQLQSLQPHVAVCTPLAPLTLEESIAYIQHCLAQVTLDSEPIFSEEALHHIVQYAGGVPRRLNMLCVDVLNAGLACAERPISAATAKHALADFRAYTPPERFWTLGRGRELLWPRLYAFLALPSWPGRRGLFHRSRTWQLQTKALLEQGGRCIQRLLQHSMQYARSGLRELRLRRIDALNARQSRRVRRQAAKAVDEILFHMAAYSRRLGWKGGLLSAVGLLCLAALVWFVFYQPAREEPFAAVGVSAQPALPVPRLQETMMQCVAAPVATAPVATAREARLTVERIRAHMQQSTNEVVRGGEQVRLLQERLHNAGFTPGPIDGVLGPRTRRALRQFQAAHGLHATGSLNAATRQALGF